MTKDTSGPAFPTPRYERGDMYSLGMTLRDYFAAKAMQGDWAAANAGRNEYNLLPDAERYYAMADAMLAARQA